MNFPSSNIRGLFEILMPGIFLILNVILFIITLSSAFAPELLPFIKQSIRYWSNPAVVILLLVVVGYPVGVVLRLLKNANIDTRSSKYIRLLHPKYRDALFLKDNFFFGKWMNEKLRSRFPAEAVKFYEEYWADKDTGDGVKNTSFFNFCKTIVAKFDPQSGNEIFAAEAMVRFLAGSYYALQISIFLMLVNTICIYKIFGFRSAIVPFLIAFGYIYLLHVILSQYRLLRCKEVDTVFNACFANRNEFDSLFPCRNNRFLLNNSLTSEFDIRRDVLLEACRERCINERLVQSVDFNKLISLMKNESKVHPYLSSLYFAGSDVDHPFFLENLDFAVGISVLPEDEPKANRQKKHPNQTEIIIVVQGTLFIHYEENSNVIDKVLNQYDHFVIRKGTCHWISCKDNTDAVYVFIKTNPSEQPRSKKC